MDLISKFVENIEQAEYDNFSGKRHYTYWIHNIIKDMFYFGVKSCDGEPNDNLGRVYFSSSSDKEFMIDQKNNPLHYKYTVCEEFETRYDADSHE